MTAKASLFSSVIYQDLVIFLLGLIAAIVLYFFFRFLITRFLTSRGKVSGNFLSRIAPPVIFSFIALILKEVLPVSRQFALYLEAALLFFIGFLFIRLADASVLLLYSRRRRPFPLPRVLHGIVLAVVYLVILFVILKEIMKVNLTPFLATSALLTMILGLAFQGVLSNILSGMSLHFTKSFNRGDWVGIGTHEGVVIDTNWRETRILDRYSNVVVIPNNTVAAEKITNFSQPDRKTALTIVFKVSFNAPAADVYGSLLEAARDCPEVLSLPAPQAYITGYDDFGVSYTLKFWIKDFARKHPITGEVGRLIWYKLRRKNIEISLPLSDKVREVLQAREVKPEIRRGKEREEREPEEKDETYSDLFHSSFLRFQEGENAGNLMVPEGEIRELASLVRRVKYTAGEILFRQGEKGTSCYIVARGLIRGEIIYEEKATKYVSEFKVGPGGIFGEMSLFSGMPRTATGIVEQEAELLEIKAEDFAALLGRNPHLAEIIAGIVSSRNQKNKEFLMKIKELSEKDVAQSCSKKSILEYLKKFVLGLKK
ncbi:MAG: mechanosensitive ion channel family protein [Candidatus Aminicenantales bacterium]